MIDIIHQNRKCFDGFGFFFNMLNKSNIGNCKTVDHIFGCSI